jgi:hypothetical protein
MNCAKSRKTLERWLHLQPSAVLFLRYIISTWALIWRFSIVIAPLFAAGKHILSVDGTIVSLPLPTVLLPPHSVPFDVVFAVLVVTWEDGI